MTRTRYLLSAMEDREIVFGEFGITTRNGYAEFTASFNTVRPFNADELEDASDYYEDLLENCYSDADKYQLCERFSCRPTELAECLADENGSDPMNIRDCSLFPEWYEIDGSNWYFENGSCGQHDTRGDMDEYTNKAAYDALHALWDAYHLKQVDTATIEAVERLQAELSKVDVEEWICDYINRQIENGEF